MGLNKLGGGGGSKTLVQDTEPSSPSEGDEWVDTSFARPAKKVFDGDQWIVITSGSNLPPRDVFEIGTNTPDGESKTYDVSDVEETTPVVIEGESGEDGHGGTKNGSGGEAGRAKVELDLSEFDNLTVEIPYNSGNSGGSTWWNTNGGDGGSSVAIFADGSRILSAGGGGGGGSVSYRSCSDDGGSTQPPFRTSGGDGADPNRGNGGGTGYGWGCWQAYDGSNGGVETNSDKRYVVNEETGVIDSNGRIEIFPKR